MTLLPLLPAVLVSAAAAVSCAEEDDRPKTPRELGRVEWTRDVDAALEASRRDGRPVFALFQEVPG